LAGTEILLEGFVSFLDLIAKDQSAPGGGLFFVMRADWGSNPAAATTYKKQGVRANRLCPLFGPEKSFLLLWPKMARRRVTEACKVVQSDSIADANFCQYRLNLDCKYKVNAM
jgi:hypothetical protein